MNLPLEIYAIFAGFIIILSVFASKISEKFGIPVLVGFLFIGMLAGSEGVLGISFNDPKLAQTIGTIALVFILFTGGLDTLFKSIKPVLKEGFILATVGVFLTAIITAAFAHYYIGISLFDSLLIGAIVSSTDAAAVFAIFRAKSINVSPKLKSLLELESGSNDPMAIFLTISILQIIVMPDAVSLKDWIIDFFLQFTVGALFGYVFGILMPRVFNRLNLDHYGLYVVFSIAWLWLIFGLTSLAGGNGFLAVYIAGIAINAKKFVHKNNLIAFYDGVSWLMQIFVFVTLGLLVNPSELQYTAFPALLIAIFIMFIARPASIFISLIFNKIGFKEKVFISWVGLRGAVPIILATYPFIYDVENALLIFNAIFFIVLFSIIIQGTSLAPVARWLKVALPDIEDKTRELNSALLPQTLKEFSLDEKSFIVDKNLSELTIPDNFFILLVKRDNNYFKPTGTTVFSANDRLVVQCEDLKKLNWVLKYLNFGESLGNKKREEF